MSVSRISLQEEVQRAVQREWPAFAESHPRLAAVLSEDLVIAGAIEAVSEDPDYRDAMQAAAQHGFLAESIADLVQRLVGRWIKTLI